MNERQPTYTLDEAKEMQRKIMKFHLSKLVFKRTNKNGVEGVDLNSTAAIEGLITHFDYAVNWSTAVAVRPWAEFFNKLQHHLRNSPQQDVIDFLLKNLNPTIQFWNEINEGAEENILLLEEELKKQGWTDDLMS